MKKKLLLIVMILAIAVTTVIGIAACNEDAIVVYTNAYFAPFEYMQNQEIVGVDVDIMNKVGEKLGKKVKFVNTDFAMVIPTVAEGKLCDAGAAGITVTDERKEKVDFSIEYYTSVQYVIYKVGSFDTATANDGNTVIYWNKLAGKKIGVQLDTTGNIYVAGEIAKDDGFDGVLFESGAECKPYDDAMLASSALKSGQIDCVVVDELPAKYIVNSSNGAYACAALYYDADSATEEQYAIAVTKGNTELLNAINEVLTEMLVKDAEGKTQIDKLVSKHFGLNG